MDYSRITRAALGSLIALLLAAMLLVMPSGSARAADSPPLLATAVRTSSGAVLPKVEAQRRTGLKCHGGLIRTKMDRWDEELWAATIIGKDPKVYKFDATVRAWYWQCPNLGYTSVLKPRKLSFCVEPAPGTTVPVMYFGHYFNAKFYGSNLRDVVDPVQVFVGANGQGVSCYIQKIARAKQRWIVNGEAHWRVHASAYFEGVISQSEPWLTAGGDTIKYLIPSRDRTTVALHREDWKTLNP